MGYCFKDLTATCQKDWRRYIEHDFVRALGTGTLDQNAFRCYLQQDYLFLIHFARAYALAAYKSRNLSDLRHAKAGLSTILDTELELHIGFCHEWGISKADLAALPEARETLAYTRYVLEAGHRGDLLDLHVALAPCLIGYGEIATWLNEQPTTVRGAANPFDAWITLYEGPEFQQAMLDEIAWLDARLAEVGPRRFQELSQTFSEATRLEIDFWQMGLDQGG